MLPAIAAWPPPLSSFLPHSYASAAARRTSPSAGAKGRGLRLAPTGLTAAHGHLPDLTAALTAAAESRPPPIDPAAPYTLLHTARQGAGA
jgi:hypothetical protein